MQTDVKPFSTLRLYVREEDSPGVISTYILPKLTTQNLGENLH